MNSRSSLALVFISALAAFACSSTSDAQNDADQQNAEGELGTWRRRALGDFAFAVGVVAMDSDAANLFEDIKGSGGEMLDGTTVLAGIKGTELGLGEKDALGITCTAGLRNKDDVCSLVAFVKSDALDLRDGAFVVSLTGKLAAAVQRGTPRTVPTRAGGNAPQDPFVSCSTSRGNPLTCAVRMKGNAVSVAELVASGTLTVEEADKVLTALY